MVIGVRPLGRIIKRGMNIVRENFGLLVPVRELWCPFVPISYSSAVAAPVGNPTKLMGKMVGAGRFELPTPGPPDRCANRAALRSDVENQSLWAVARKNKAWLGPR